MAKLRGAGHSDVGRRRERNEDAFFVDHDLGLFIVSDGMGGHAAGDVASRAAVDAAVAFIRSEVDTLRAIDDGAQPESELAGLVEQAVAHACMVVYEMASRDRAQRGMGCTLTLLFVRGETGAMAHVGDSRLYLLRGGRIDQLSNDHTIAGELLRAGLLTVDDIDTHPFAHTLSRSIGTQAAVRIDTLVFPVLEGDRLLLCSDGLSNYFPEAKALIEPSSHLDLHHSVNGLCALANEAGGKDNITAVLVHVDGLGFRPNAESLLPESTSTVGARYAALRSVFLFEELDLPLLMRVLQRTVVNNHETNGVALEEGDRFHELFIVVSGRYRVMREGRVVGELGAGDYTGAMVLYSERVSRGSLVAAEPSTILRLSAEDLTKLIRERPWLGIGLLERLGRRLSDDLERSFRQRSGDGSDVASGELL